MTDILRICCASDCFRKRFEGVPLSSSLGLFCSIFKTSHPTICPSAFRTDDVFLALDLSQYMNNDLVADYTLNAYVEKGGVVPYILSLDTR